MSFNNDIILKVLYYAILTYNQKNSLYILTNLIKRFKSESFREHPFLTFPTFSAQEKSDIEDTRMHPYK